MTATIHLTHAAEIYTREGSTGRFAEVVRGEVRDHGGNILFAGTADECVANRGEWRIPVVLVATELRAVAGEVSGADHTWQLVVEG